MTRQTKLSQIHHFFSLAHTSEISCDILPGFVVMYDEEAQKQNRNEATFFTWQLPGIM